MKTQMLVDNQFGRRAREFDRNVKFIEQIFQRDAPFR